MREVCSKVSMGSHDDVEIGSTNTKVVKLCGKFCCLFCFSCFYGTQSYKYEEGIPNVDNGHHDLKEQFSICSCMFPQFERWAKKFLPMASNGSMVAK